MIFALSELRRVVSPTSAKMHLVPVDVKHANQIILKKVIQLKTCQATRISYEQAELIAINAL